MTEAVTVVAGQSATVTCKASGSPAISWVDEDKITELPTSQYSMIGKQPIRTRYLGHVTGYQPIRDQYFPIFHDRYKLKRKVSQIGTY